jgi:hypothetical protein
VDGALFQHFSACALGQGFPQLKQAPREAPEALGWLLATLDQEYFLVSHYDGSHADPGVIRILSCHAFSLTKFAVAEARGGVYQISQPLPTQLPFFQHQSGPVPLDAGLE